MKLFGSLIILLFSLASFAAPSTSIMSAEQRAAMQNPWGGLLQATYGQSLYNQEDGSESAAMGMAAELSYKINHDYKMNLHLEGTQDLRHQEDSDMGVGFLGIKHSEIKVADRMFLLTPSMQIRFPISRADQESSFLGGVIANLTTAMNPAYLISKKLSVALSLVGMRYVHTYEEAANGDLNTEYKFAQVFSLGFDFTSWMGISAEIDHINAWDYHGLQKEFYNHTEELNFTVDKNWSMALGHQYGNGMVSVWAANQQDYDFKLVDETNSLVFGQVTYTF